MRAGSAVERALDLHVLPIEAPTEWVCSARTAKGPRRSRPRRGPSGLPAAMRPNATVQGPHVQLRLQTAPKCGLRGQLARVFDGGKAGDDG